MMRRAFGIVAVCALAAGGVVAATTASAAGESITITYPADGQTVGTGPLTVAGSVSSGKGDKVNVLYAVDVSGSTASPTGLDCNGDTQITAELDDFNQDGSVGDTLDCEISGIVALNAALRAVPNSAQRIRAGVVAFGNDAAVADLEPGADDIPFVAPGDTRNGEDVTPRINAVAGSLTRGTIGLETPRSVGQGTDFQRPLDVGAAELTNADAGAKWIFLLSDGQASVPDTTALVAAGIRVRTFAIGAAASCEVGSPLEQIATTTGDTCVRVDDPSQLSSDITTGGPSSIRAVTVQLDAAAAVPATVDSIGNFSAAVGSPSDGGHTITVRAEITDGSTVTETRRFTVRGGSRYVALGDSFSAGEGVDPYVDQQVDRVVPVGRGQSITFYKQTPGFLCHRSTKGWPRKITLPGSSTPVATGGGAFDFQACSGARLVNVDTQPFEKEYRDVKTDIPLQNLSLGTDVDLVTMTFGGNDVGFVPILKHCIAHYDCQNDAFVTVNGRPVSLDAWTRIRMALIQNELDGLYRQVRSRVRPETTMVVATYPRLLKVGNRFCTEGAVIAEGERRWLADRVNEFDDAMADRARRSGALVADVRDEFAGNAVCDADNYITGVRPVRGTDLGGVTSAASFHPNDKGTSAYARVVSKAISDGAPSPLALAAVAPAPSGAVTGAAQRAAAPAVAVRQARSAESVARKGPVKRIVSVAIRLFGRHGGGKPRPSDDQILTRYPKEVVAAVAATTLSTVAIGDGAAMRQKPSCNGEVVRGEWVPFAADGFRAGAMVTARVAWQGGRIQPATTVRAGADGRATGWIQMPSGLPSSGFSSVEVRGAGANGGPVLGFENVKTTTKPDCVAMVKEAGLTKKPAS